MTGRATGVAEPSDRILESRFRALVETWKREDQASSSAVQRAMHPAYQQIIGMGPRVLPLLLTELQREPDHWFWALRAVTGEDPVPLESRGNIGKMRDAWLQWGHVHGYIAQDDA